jgi:hypothetical protein
MIKKPDKKAQNVHVNFKITQADKSNLVPLSTKSHLAINNTQNTYHTNNDLPQYMENREACGHYKNKRAKSGSPTPVFINQLLS